MGSWLTYGLGSESQNLPGYVVLTAGRGSSGGATLWQSGFLTVGLMPACSVPQSRESRYSICRIPEGLPMQLQRRGLDTLREISTASRLAHDARSGDRLPDCQFRAGVSNAVGRSGIDRSVRGRPSRRLSVTGSAAKETLKGGARGTGRGLGVVLPQLSVGPADGRTGCAVHQHHSCFLGPSFQSGQRAGLQRRDGRSADCCV